VVSNGAYVLRTRLKDPADLKLLTTMEQAVARGALLTQQLLSFARQQPFKPLPHDINSVIHGFQAVLNRGIRGDIAFRLNLGSVAQVLLDSSQFETALLNLVVNARDATPDGGVIEISTQTVKLNTSEIKQLASGRYVRVTVRDSGVGMSAQIADRALEPFFTTKALGKGTGLGLSQVLGMVQQSGGDLTIESASSEGTSVHLYFPVSASAEATEQNHNLDMVLVVDDQTDVLETTAELFRTLGFEVATANSGEEAMQILRRTPKVTLLLTDMVMPGMNGMELARHARKLTPQIKVIVASGYSSALTSKNEEMVEGIQFLSKPYGVAELVRSLRVVG
jgi:CheY-like chemotaxis protein